MKKIIPLLLFLLILPPVTASAASNMCTSKSFTIRNWKGEVETPADDEIVFLGEEAIPPELTTPASTEEPVEEQAGEIEPVEQGEDQPGEIEPGDEGEQKQPDEVEPTIPPDDELTLTTPPASASTTPASTDEVETVEQGEPEEQGNEVEQAAPEGEPIEQGVFFGDDLNAHEVEQAVDEHSGEVETEEPVEDPQEMK